MNKQPQAWQTIKPTDRVQSKLTQAELIEQGFSKTFLQRFWKKVKKSGDIPKHVPELGECWTWLAGTNAYGYAFIRQGANAEPHILAHRASWLIHYGPIPKGKFVLHRCDNPQCCNPEHLFIGTHLDNARDKMAKGRFRTLRAEEHGMAKLTWEQVRTIRREYKYRVRPYSLFAKRHGMSRSVIAGIIKYQNWKEDVHVTAKDNTKQ